VHPVTSKLIKLEQEENRMLESLQKTMTAEKQVIDKYEQIKNVDDLPESGAPTVQEKQVHPIVNITSEMVDKVET
jgi:hypothetical protein